MSTNTELYEYYLAAEIAILDGQVFMHNGRRLELPDLITVQAERRRLKRLVDAERGIGAGGFKVATFASKDRTQ